MSHDEQDETFWYDNAIIYELDVETFQDSDSDGIGDFPGLTARLDYLHALGITALWLMPFYPSPNRDDGYDVTDYLAVDPRLGTLEDFDRFMAAARERDIEVLIDLVVQHSSDEHPWFLSARAKPTSPYRDWYIWSESPPPSHEIIFPGQQHGNWSYDEKAGAFYRHIFYADQPDLNFTNHEVRKEIERIMRFWIDRGVAGFRVDAVPFMLDFTGMDVSIDDPHDLLREMSDALRAMRSDAVLMGEVNLPADQIARYFGEADHQMHMVLNFLLNQPLWQALAMEDSMPLVKALQEMPPIPRADQWANFLRNHDELNLGNLANPERERVLDILAPHETMRSYGRGTRRRMAPMLQGNRAKAELAYSLLLTMPGAVVLYYGDEIGMSEHLGLADRLSVRTPMQWEPEEGGGFSDGPPEWFVRPMVSGGDFGYERVNVTDQLRDSESLLCWLTRLLGTRHACPEIGRGKLTVLPTDAPAVLAHCYSWSNSRLLLLHNLAGEPCTVALPSSMAGQPLYPLFGSGTEPRPQDSRITLGEYGYQWYRLSGDTDG